MLFLTIDLLIAPSSKIDNLLQYVLEAVGIDTLKATDLKIDVHTCSGYVSKLGNFRKNWKRRYLVFDLATRVITYYDSDAKRVNE